MANDTNEPPKSQPYDPATAESKWYDLWEERGYFKPKLDGRRTYCVMIPPPNITGSLHVGHALNNTLQDILVRWRRMEGDDVLWQPGTDHAGIATQKVVSDLLMKQEKKTRFDLGREAFLKRIWDWKEESGGNITRQLRRLGASCDWSRERFTMDDGLSKAVREAFVRLYEKKQLERDRALTNWCPSCKTVLSDLEVEHEEVAGRPLPKPDPKTGEAKIDYQSAGRLYHIKYPLTAKVGTIDHIVVATTRPETMLGDTAVAVHPEDERYAAIVKAGVQVKLPLTDRTIPVVADTYVEKDFGSGVVKITPAHDPNDFEVGRRHKLPMISIFDEDAKVNENGFAYKGQDRYAARKAILADLTSQGLLAKIEGHPMKIGHCQRCNTVVEPMLSTQWFVRTKPLAAAAMAAVRAKKTKFIPPAQEDAFFRWMENIRDWCVSRQLWWGHQIPAWYCVKEDGAKIIQGAHGYSIAEGATPIVAREKPATCPRCGGAELVQDPDVLDTWFSSGTWPFSTLGWPEKTKALELMYPTSVLITAYDILFFWVARMMMFGLEFTGQVPFEHVYIHGLVRDERGDKMSKTKGNVLDPLVLMEKYGTDALRFTIAALTAQGSDVKLSEKIIEGYRNFANKIWNASKLVLSHAEGMNLADARPGRTLADRWIVSRLQAVIDEVKKSLHDFRYNDAASALYQFAWHELCDWYLEMIKPVLNDRTPDGEAVRTATLATALGVFEQLLRLMHPVMPFLTEEIWQMLPMERATKSIVIAPYPKASADLADASAEDAVALMQEVVTAVRNIRGEMGIDPKKKVALIANASELAPRELLATLKDMVSDLAKLESFEIRESGTPPKGAATAIVEGIELFVPLAGLVDPKVESARLAKEVGKLDGGIDVIMKKLGNDNFVKNAPEDVVIEQREKLMELQQKRDKLQESLTRLKEMGG